jgi:hypothetical protein
VGINDIRFQAIYWKSIDMMRPETVLADFTPAGPIEGTHQPLSGVNRIVADPRGTTWYGTSGHSLVKLDLKNQKATKLEVQGDLPEMSWPDGVAWDSKRNRVVITSHGGVGYMYSYEPDANKWSLITDMRNTDLCSFTYSSEEDCYFGLVASLGTGDMYIRDYAPNGAAGRDTSLGRRGGENDRMMVHIAPPQLVAAGKYLVVLFPPPTPDRRQATGPMSCVVLEIKSRKIIYSGDLRPRVAPADVALPQFEQHWQALHGNAADAEQATMALAGGGDGVVKLLRGKLQPLSPVDQNRIEALISQLDAEGFGAREEATAQLRKLGPAAEPAVKKALTGNISADQRKRLEAILPDLKPLSGNAAAENLTDPDLRREARAIRVLALIGTPDAADFLRELTRGPAGATRIILARSALQNF